MELPDFQGDDHVGAVCFLLDNLIKAGRGGFEAALYLYMIADAPCLRGGKIREIMEHDDGYVAQLILCAFCHLPKNLEWPFQISLEEIENEVDLALRKFGHWEDDDA